MSDTSFSFDVNTAQFELAVLEKSHQVPVLVDFWAEWCAPCRTLKPMLEQLASDYAGAFLLAKVNTEEEQELASHFGIRSLPTVKLFADGSVVDEFMGALPEDDVRELLNRHLQAPPRPSDALREQAQAALSNGDRDTAIALLRQAIDSDPDNHPLYLDLATLLLDNSETDAARACLDSVADILGEQDDYKALIARLSFASDAPLDLAQLRQQVAAAPDDSSHRLELVDALVQSGDHAAAMDQLLTLVGRDDGTAREKMLKLFEMLGDDPLVKTYRARLFNALH